MGRGKADLSKGKTMDMTVQSASGDVRTMLLDAIVAVQAASASGKSATVKIEEQASDPALKDLLRQGSRHAEEWRERLSAASQMLGGTQAAAEGNPIIDAIQQVGGKIISKATDATARDLGIIASGQLALHYYIAAFGTMAAYAQMLGMDEVAQPLHACLDEAKRGDARYTELADRLGK